MIAVEALPVTPTDLLGPYGLVVATLLAVSFLSRELFKFIREFITSKDIIIADQKLQIMAALKGWQEQTENNRVLADAQASRNRDDEMRHRLQDAQGPTASKGTGRD